MKPKYRYNVQTKEWYILMSAYDYGRLMQELEMLRQQVSRQINVPRQLGPYEMPNPFQYHFMYGINRGLPIYPPQPPNALMIIK